jgi:hypothetical protein
MVTTDLRKTVPELAVSVSVYFLEGKWVYTCHCKFARSYFDVLKAPAKGFYSFDPSAHSPMFEEPKRVVEILHHDVLKGRTQPTDQ